MRRVLPLLLAPIVAATVFVLPSTSSTASTADQADRPAAGAQEAPTQARPRITGSRVRPHQRWLLDPRGRVLVMHGVNMVYKRAPYAPDKIGFGRDDARFLARQGFTTVRLGLIWRAVEPRPGKYNDAYLERIRRTTKLLAAEGIWTLLDFHQDLFHERFQGEGAPTWAVLDKGLPAAPQQGFPVNYFVMPGLNAAFDSFWHNAKGPGGVGLQDRYAAAWAHVAGFFGRTPSVLGLDLFNEPWPGSLYAACVNPLGCPTFDPLLQRFSERVIRAIRRVDHRTPVFYEPNILFNNGVPSGVRPEGRRLGFSFHDYCLTADLGLDGIGLPTGEKDPLCGTFDTLVWKNAAAHTRRTGDPGLLTEFGATTDTAVLRDMVRRAEESFTGWQYWAYCGCDDPTTTGPGKAQALVFDPAKPPRGRNVDHAKLRALVVPHPIAVAGTPTLARYDRTARVFRAEWTTHRAAGSGAFRAGARTVLSTPRLAYAHGYRVHVTGGRVVSAPNARRLVVVQGRHAQRVTVRVTPRT